MQRDSPGNRGNDPHQWQRPLRRRVAEDALGDTLAVSWAADAEL
jgi:hypothetical protein